MMAEEWENTKRTLLYYEEEPDNWGMNFPVMIC